MKTEQPKTDFFKGKQSIFNNKKQTIEAKKTTTFRLNLDSVLIYSQSV